MFAYPIFAYPIFGLVDPLPLEADARVGTRLQSRHLFRSLEAMLAGALGSMEARGGVIADGRYEFAIVFADIVGSTKLFETAGDVAAKTLVSDLESQIAEVGSRAGGQVIQVVGDEVIFRFDEVDTAAAAALTMHEQAEAFSKSCGTSMSLRIGINFGPVLFEGGRVFGDTINVASRLTAIAKSQQTITSHEVVDRLGPTFRSRARRFDQVRVKGKRLPLVVFDLPWRASEVTRIETLASVTGVTTPELTLYYADELVSLDRGDSGFTIGRSAESGLVIAADCVSRHHAQLEFAHGKFMLLDQSTNGSYVVTQDGQSVYLRREALPLWGHGQIGLGRPVAEGGPHCLGFSCRSSAEETQQDNPSGPPPDDL